MTENISFRKLVRLLTQDLYLDYKMRGSHYIFRKPGTDLLVTIQPYGSDGVKAYQLKQLERALVDRGLVSAERWNTLLRKARK